MENNRVTHIIQSVFPTDFSHVPDNVLQNAIDFGNAIHLMCALYLKGTLDEKTLDSQLLSYLTQFRKWIVDSHIEVLGHEKQLVSSKYNYRGTPDIWGKIKGRLCVVDIKSTSTISKTIGLQLSAYELLVKESIGGNVQYCDRYVLRLFPDKYEFLPIKRKSDMSAWLATLTIFNYSKEVGI